jgi:anti-sigma B factor antagonist
VIVRLHGDATLTETDSLRDALSPALEAEPPCVVLDLSDLEFINSMGLGVLVEFRQELTRRGGQMRLAGATEAIAEMLRRTRLVELFPPYSDCDQALESS